MNKLFTSILEMRRRYKKFRKKNKTYKIINYSLTAFLAIYGLLLIFPQFLFAHEVSHKNFNVYTNQPLAENIVRVLDAAEARLLKSPIYDKNLKENIFIAGSHGFYKFFTIKGNSFGSTIPVIGHSRINKSDIENDLVFRNASEHNKRSLSGVIAHETMHNQIIEKLGLAKYLTLPSWKDEGYCEYVAGETTLSFEEGARLWKENPNDSSKYNYFKYQQMVKYLLEDEKISVEDLFNRDFDAKDIEQKVYKKICQN